MAYTKTVWQDNVTPVNATNLNNIENGITSVEALANGNAVPADVSLTTPKYSNRSITPEKLSFVTQLPNLIDKLNLSYGKLVNATGALVTSASYDSSPYVPIENGKTYTFSPGIRYICDYDLSKTFKSVIVSTSYQMTPFTFTATRNGYIIASWFATNTKTIVMQEGTTADENYSDYGFKFDTTKIKTDYPVPYDITVKKEGEVFYIRSSYDSTNDIILKTIRNGSNNGAFALSSTKITPKTTTSYDSGTLIHDVTDDITPIRTFTTIGANHGYTSIVAITMATHDKTTADLGSKWTDGTTQYTLLDIQGTKLIFGCPYTETNAIVSASTINPVANLTHVSGATHTTNVDVTTKDAAPQLYPSINNLSVKFILDGVELTTDGLYYGKELQVQESYNIMDYKAIIDYAQANIGVSYKNDNVGGVIKMTINYTFTKGCNCLMSHGLKALRKVSLGTCGFLQSVGLSLAGHTLKRYMPNVLVKGGIDFKNIQDMTSYNVTTAFYQADFVSPSKPPNRYVDWLYNGTTKKYGFTLGYIPDKTNAKDSDRLASVSTTGYAWDMRNSKKSYPTAIYAATLNTGDYKTFLGYRNYIAPNSTATSISITKDKKDVYVFLDYHQNVTGENIKLNDYIGKTVTVIDSENFTLLNDTVDADGVSFTITNNYGYAILKLN